VDHSSLRLLADGGFTAYPPSEFPNLAEWCWDFGVASADARYFILSRIFSRISEAFGDAELVTAEIYKGLNGTLVRSLKGVIDEQDPSAATLLANRLLEDILSALNP